MDTHKKILHSVDDLAEQTGLGRNSIYKEINAGELETIKIGRRRFATSEQRDHWIKRKEESCRAIS